MKLSALAGVVAVALAAVGVALAQPPSHLQDSFTFGPFIQDCGTFDIEFEGSGEVHGTEYYDRDGNAIRIVAHVRITETDVNTTTLKTLVVRSVYTEVFDLVAGTYTVNGMRYMSNDPGSGSALQDTGRITFNPDGSVDIHGPHEVFDTQAAIFCEALS